jgi:TAT (twin-arginine translocation) pathway signal sequence
MVDQRLDRRHILKGAAALGALGALAALQGPTLTRAGDEEDEHERSLIGAWEFTVTVPASGFLLRGLKLVAPGGITLITDELEFRQHEGPGFGAWVQTGERTFALTFVRQHFDATGTLVGKETIRETNMLDDNGDAFSGSATFKVSDLTGTVVSAGSATVQGTRIEIEN